MTLRRALQTPALRRSAIITASMGAAALFVATIGMLQPGPGNGTTPQAGCRPGGAADCIVAPDGADSRQSRTHHLIRMPFFSFGSPVRRGRRL